MLRLVYQFNNLVRLIRFTWIVVFYYGFYRMRRLAKRNPISSLKSDFSPSDVTIVCPCVDPDGDFIPAIKSWLRADPHEVLIVTTVGWHGRVKARLESIDDPRVTVHAIEVKGKRPGLIAGIQRTTTDVVVLLDDDSIWSPATLQGLLCGLSAGPRVAGVINIKVNIRKARPALAPDAPSLFEAMGAGRHDRRAITNAAMAYFCDGQLTCCNGRTTAYRTEALQSPGFVEHVVEDYWKGKYKLASGDDRAITRWLYQKGWKTGIVVHDECAMVSRPKGNTDYLKQLLRWSRSEVRQLVRDIYLLLPSTKTARKKVWFISLIYPLFLEEHFVFLDLILTSVIIICRAFFESNVSTVGIPSNFLLLLQYLGTSALLELVFNLWHFTRYPEMLRHVLVYALWGQVRMVVSLYALFTLDHSSWLTRTGAA
ncbi:nucleotide-diphospho-sugar transferase [Aspergillus bertholletiae]|uniref:Nucleotide-diphospho-sugar transferase n=1 Tax=Aspergillus bertholletiae TaxID=1226010 RepID=A0A5N7B8S9_9EURO|nr:nucleotide-diphospho-sugar transferase [Aspergillus bertholletiae]